MVWWSSVLPADCTTAGPDSAAATAHNCSGKSRHARPRCYRGHRPYGGAENNIKPPVKEFAESDVEIDISALTTGFPAV